MARIAPATARLNGSCGASFGEAGLRLDAMEVRSIVSSASAAGECAYIAYAGSAVMKIGEDAITREFRQSTNFSFVISDLSLHMTER
ncbi:hypothetical protein [Methylosinus sp. PW1]|uniref:hypothetical protein n=1 Tax=Methylosinus sp. PW1 TaxID=107636 RepID=UPI0018DB9A0A|nr:hypothetical protein [Methylosinus sp. PW1]